MFPKNPPNIPSEDDFKELLAQLGGRKLLETTRMTFVRRSIGCGPSASC